MFRLKEITNLSYLCVPLERIKKGMKFFMKKIFLELKNLDKLTYKIMGYGLIFSSIITFIAVSILILYIFLGINFFYHLGIALIKSSFYIGTQFIICGIIVDSIKKNLV